MPEPSSVSLAPSTWPLRESRVDHVCVFREGAEVTRIALLQPGDTRVALRGLPLDLRAHEVRVEVDSGSVRAFHLEAEEHDKTAPHFASQAELDAAHERLRAIELAVEDAQSLQARIGALGIPERPAPVHGSPPRPAPDLARLELFDLRADLYTKARKDIQALQRERETLTRRVQTLNAAKHAEGQPQGEVTQCLYAELDASAATTLRLVYRVRPAKWAPTYRFFYERKSARGVLVMRALVAQRTGEDWTSARISVSTAMPAQWAELPELASLRVGRAQPPVKASGFRTLPEDSSALFSDYDRALPAMREEPTPSGFGSASIPMPRAITLAAPMPPTAPMLPGAMPITAMPVGAPMPQAPPPASRGGVLGGLFGGGGAPAASMSAGPPLAKMAPPAAAAPARMRASKMDDAEMMMESAASYGDEGGAMPEEAPASGRVKRPNLDFMHLRLDAPNGARRGRLQHERSFGEDGRARAREAGAEASANHFLYALAPPPGLSFPEDAYGFDFQYDAIDRSDVPRDGTFHAIAVAEGNASAQLIHVAVPREDVNVYRTFTLASPLEGAVLRGPVDIFFDGVLALTSALSPTPPQGTLRIGAGIDEQVRVARNVRYSEETSGLMGGWTHLQHAIEIELRNNSAVPITLELRERVPVTNKGEKEIELRYGASTVGWTDLEQAHEPEGAAVLEGGRKARIDLAPSAVETVRYDYAIRIATANELVGGNRRD